MSGLPSDLDRRAGESNVRGGRLLLGLTFLVSVVTLTALLGGWPLILPSTPNGCAGSLVVPDLSPILWFLAFGAVWAIVAIALRRQSVGPGAVTILASGPLALGWVLGTFAIGAYNFVILAACGVG